MRLKELRRKNEVKQIELIVYLNMDQKTYHNIENGLTTRFRLDTFIKLAYLYDVSLDYLLGITDKKERFPIDKEEEIIKKYDINLYLVEKIRKEKGLPQKNAQP